MFANIPAILKVIFLLLLSNSFMLYAWYGHLKTSTARSLWLVILMSWGFAFFEYAFQVPANRIGFSGGDFSLAQLKILQEVITLSLFIPFAMFYMNQPFNWNFLWAGLCLVGAVFFIFR